MKLDLSGREYTDIGPLVRQAWKYGETIELFPAGCYYSSRQVFPSLKPWHEARCRIIGAGYQGVEIQPLPTYSWGLYESMWQFNAGRVGVHNLMFADPVGRHKRIHLQFGDNGSVMYEEGTVEACDIRQYSIGILGERFSELTLRDNDLLGGDMKDTPEGYEFITGFYLHNCNGVHALNNWIQGGRGALWFCDKHGPGMGEQFEYLGRGMAWTEIGLDIRGGDCFNFGNNACFDTLPGGIAGIRLMGSADFPCGGVTIQGAWVGGHGNAKILCEGVGVFNVTILGGNIVGDTEGDGLVCDGDVWNVRVDAPFIDLDRAIVKRGNARLINSSGSTFSGIRHP